MLLGVLAQLGHPHGIDRLDRAALLGLAGVALLAMVLVGETLALEEARLIGIELDALGELILLKVAGRDQLVGLVVK